MTEKIITLLLPAKGLSPNARLHFRRKAEITKAHRQAATLISSVALDSGDEVDSYMLHFFWPDKRRRDRDNASSSCKAYMDGLADRTGQDDSFFEFNGVRFAIDKKDPRVEIRVVLKGKS